MCGMSYLFGNIENGWVAAIWTPERKQSIPLRVLYDCTHKSRPKHFRGKLADSHWTEQCCREGYLVGPVAGVEILVIFLRGGDVLNDKAQLLDGNQECRHPIPILR